MDTPPQEQHRAPQEHWHLDKKVPISLLLVMLMQGIAGIWAIADIKKDVEVLKSVAVQQIDRDNRQDRAAFEAVGLVREDIKEVKSMIARVLDRYDRYQQPDKK